MLSNLKFVVDVYILWILNYWRVIKYFHFPSFLGKGSKINAFTLSILFYLFKLVISSWDVTTSDWSYLAS